MSNPMGVPPVELLDAEHDFPCVYTFKIIVNSDPGIEDRVAKAVQDELALPQPPKYTQRDTSKHTAITIEVMCPSAHKVQDVYKKLMGVPGVILLL